MLNWCQGDCLSETSFESMMSWPGGDAEARRLPRTMISDEAGTLRREPDRLGDVSSRWAVEHKTMDCQFNETGCRTMIDMEGSKNGVSRVVWITGYSGAGKSTMTRHLATRLRGLGHCTVIMDADDLKEVYQVEGYRNSRAMRIEWALRTARLCKYIAEQGVIVLRPTIQLFHEVLEWNRANQPNYREVWLDTSIEKLRSNDVTGLYSKWERGEEQGVFGVDLEADLPHKPHWKGDYRFANDPDTALETVTELVVNPIPGDDDA